MKIANRRSNIQIIADMLRLGEAGKTEIMYSANMSYFQLQKYLKFLLELKLIEEILEPNVEESAPTFLKSLGGQTEKTE